MTEKRIIELYEKFCKELEGADSYLHCAEKYGKLPDYESWAPKYLSMASEELGHAGNLWNMMLHEIEKCEHQEMYDILKEMGAKAFSKMERKIKIHKSM